jgi:DNA-binding response OmpR family regulator
MGAGTLFDSLEAPTIRGSGGGATQGMGDFPLCDSVLSAEKHLMAEARKSVLIVEDHWDTAEILTEILEKENYAVRHVPNAVQALQVLTSPEASGISVILLDLTLPDMDGDEVLRSLANGGSRIPPVLIMSAKPAHSLEEAARTIGAAGVIQKPFDIEELLDRLRSLLG